MAFGYVNNGGALSASGNGSFALGRSQSPVTILSSGSGSICAGLAGDGGGSPATFVSSGNGCLALGYAYNNSTLAATNNGCMAVGLSTDNGTLMSTGNASFALGWVNSNGENILASGHASVAITDRSSVTASQSIALAMGYNIVTNSEAGQAFGEGHNNTTVRSMYLGRFSVNPPSNPTTWVSTDPLFVCGNGASSGSRSNAFMVLKDSTTTIGASGATPTHGLNTSLGANASNVLTLTNAPTAITGNPTGYITINVNGTLAYMPFWS